MVLLRVKVVWSSVRIPSGVLCVTMPGVLTMPLWSVDNWDTLKSVRFVSLLHNLPYSLFNVNNI